MYQELSYLLLYLKLQIKYHLHYQQHLHRTFAVPAHAVKDGAAAVRLVVDGVSNLHPLGAEDGKLHGLSVGVDDEVGHIRREEEHGKAVHHRLDAVEDEERRRDNAHVDVYHHAADADVGVLRHHRGDDVSAARRAAVDKAHAYAHAGHHAADDAAHERVEMEDVAAQRYAPAQVHRYHRGAEDCAHHKVLAHNLVRNGK